MIDFILEYIRVHVFVISDVIIMWSIYSIGSKSVCIDS